MTRTTLLGATDLRSGAIREGQRYICSGFLVIRRPNGDAVPSDRHAARIVLSPRAFGEESEGDHEVPLRHPLEPESLLTLARQHGPAARVLVHGRGEANGVLAVTLIVPDRSGLAPD